MALNVSGQRITHQPNLSGEPDPKGMQLRIDGKLVSLTSSGITLPKGGRIIRTPAAGGVQVEFPGGSTVVITPYFWDYYQVVPGCGCAQRPQHGWGDGPGGTGQLAACPARWRSARRPTREPERSVQQAVLHVRRRLAGG